MRASQINIRVSPEERAAWERVSIQNDMTISDIARRFLNALATGKIKNIPIVPRPSTSALDNKMHDQH